MVWPAVIAAGASIASSLLSSSMSKDASQKNTQTQIDWNREAMQNKHQWEVQDLRKAGLNPILSATNGSSSVPGISPQMPVISTPDFDSAVSAYNASSQDKLRKQQVAQSEKQTQLLEQQIQQMQLDNERTRMELEKLRKAPQFLDTGGNVTNMPQMLWHLVSQGKQWFEKNVSSAKSVGGITKDISNALDRGAPHYKRYFDMKTRRFLKNMSGNYRGLND